MRLNVRFVSLSCHLLCLSTITLPYLSYYMLTDRYKLQVSVRVQHFPLFSPLPAISSHHDQQELQWHGPRNENATATVLSPLLCLTMLAPPVVLLPQRRQKNSAAPGDSESESDAVTESAGRGEGEADGLVHARTDAAKAAWTKKLGTCPPSLSNLPLTLVSAIMQQKWHAKSYAHFLSEVAVVWNDKQDQWEQQFTCTRCVSSFS